MSNLALDNIRKNVIYQNSIDIWIATCQEKGIGWNDTKKYQTFIGYLLKSGLNMKKFPLCIKESGGDFDRGQEKTKFGDALSELNNETSAAYTIKLNDAAIGIIRKFSL